VLERSGAKISCRAWSDRERCIRAVLVGYGLESTVAAVEEGYAGDRHRVWKVKKVKLTVKILPPNASSQRSKKPARGGPGAIS